MEKNKLIKFLNLIPDDVRCNIHGEYNGIGYECLVDVWCGKHLIRGWKDKIDSGEAVEEIFKTYVADNWRCVSDDVDDDIMKSYNFDECIEDARAALKVDWDEEIRNEIAKYVSDKPTQNQVQFAHKINVALNKNKYFGKNTTKLEYDKFIKDNLNEYKDWLSYHDPSNFGY